VKAPGKGAIVSARGFRAAGATAGIKASGSPDLALVVSDVEAACAGVFTTNRVKAAPVRWSEAIVRKGTTVRAVLINSGNANACTGKAGRKAVERSVAATASALGIDRKAILVASTGIIGVPLPVDRLVAAIPPLVNHLGRAASHGSQAAHAILTTDTRVKEHAVMVRVNGHTYRIGGMAKGAGMIHPDMATLLGMITTDAPLGQGQARNLLRKAVISTFNAISVDGDTSTNDCVFLLANGAAGGHIPVGGMAESRVAEALLEVCSILARKVAADGEGARKLLEVTVRGARSTSAARVIARAIASSSLVKTAVHGGDPNWGRIFAAAGRCGVPVRVECMELRIGGHLVAAGGTAVSGQERRAAQHLRKKTVEVDLSIGRGTGTATAFGCDLSAEYVSINAEYRT
jgi:glutamate N-acetyltransferase / amino-acid N-acetyltransferase